MHKDLTATRKCFLDEPNCIRQVLQKVGPCGVRHFDEFRLSTIGYLVGSLKAQAEYVRQSHHVLFEKSCVKGTQPKTGNDLVSVVTLYNCLII